MWDAEETEMVMFHLVKTARALAVLSTFALGFAGTMQAATLDVSGVNGTWTGLSSGTGQNPTHINGLGTSTVRWGTPFRGAGGTGEQSGYNFTGIATGIFNSGVEFNLGTFTHFNKTINKGTSISGASLGLAVSIAIGGVPQAITAAFNFAHDETLNFGESNGRCKDGGALNVGINDQGCADQVTILNNAGSANQFTIDGVIYVLEITGFIVGGQPFTEFWTRERADNTAVLRARFREVGGTTSGGGGGGGNPTPSPIPLPGAAWLILSALAAMLVVGRKSQST
jgi:hypothetical protein